MTHAQCSYKGFRLAMNFIIIIGASLSEPHINGTVVYELLCMGNDDDGHPYVVHSIFILQWQHVMFYTAKSA